MKRKESGGLLEIAKTIVSAIVIALVLRTVAYEPFNIPSGSMLPTLLIGDYVFVSKFAYGYSRYSLPFWAPPVTGRLFGSLPRRGDVAVFRLPRDPKVDYIKRIVGLPGDRIQVSEGVLQINGDPVRLERMPAFRDDEWGYPHRVPEFMETLPGGVSHPILQMSSNGPLDNTGVYVVPPGAVFAMGDNRDNSEDSRVLDEVGFIPLDNLVGKAVIRFFSIDPRAEWWQVWRWPTAIRWGRLFTVVK